MGPTADWPGGYDLTQRIFEWINVSLAERGLFMREEIIIDATIVAAVAPLRTRPGNEIQK